MEDRREELICELMALMLDSEQITGDLNEYLEAGEYGLAIEELGAIIMGRP